MTTPFSDNPIMIGYDNTIFEGDNSLGFCFPERKLITSTEFRTLDEIISSIKARRGYPQLGYPIILNMGDSSTSGWNSDRVFTGNINPIAPFFTYKTYSQIMEEELFASVINAGVPGYSSYQGKRYLEYLLRQTTKAGIRVDYVTLYFGNNDGTYNQHEDKVRIDRKNPSRNTTGERVTVTDFEKNILAMIELCREYGCKPIIIIPLVRHLWEPGIRSQVHRNESIVALEQLGECLLREELDYARKLYQRQKYTLACKKDRILPRLKLAYKKVLLHVAKMTKTPLIDIQTNIPLYADDYFVDYCHPTERTNQLIVAEFGRIRYRNLSYKESLLQRIRTAFLSKRIDNKSPPTNVYAGLL